MDLRQRTSDVRGIASLTAAVCLFVAGLCQAQDLGTDDQRAAGKELYELKCSQCHGLDGGADGSASPFFRPGPRDFTSGVFKFRTSASGELPTNADLERSIKDGMPYTGMPAWPGLSDTEVENLIYHIKTFNDDFAGPYGNPVAVESSEPARAAHELARDEVPRGIA